MKKIIISDTPKCTVTIKGYKSVCYWIELIMDGSNWLINDDGAKTLLEYIEKNIRHLPTKRWNYIQSKSALRFEIAGFEYEPIVRQFANFIMNLINNKKFVIRFWDDSGFNFYESKQRRDYEKEMFEKRVLEKGENFTPCDKREDKIWY